MASSHNCFYEKWWLHCVAQNLINKARQELADVVIQQQIVELIETIVLYKFPHLSREELEAMLGLSELKQTRVYQEAREEGRLEGFEEGIEQGIERGQLQAKLGMIPRLQQRALSIEEIAELLALFR